jgi:hypothetical protein
MLVELPQTRQDGIWFFDKSYAGSLAIKLYSTVTTQLHLLNTVSSDIRKCFTISDGTGPNPNAISFYRRFSKSKTLKELQGILRIHAEFPKIPNGEPYVLVDQEDVFVYVDCSNMDAFFDEGVHSDRETMRNIKRMIRYVTASPSGNRKSCNCKVEICNKRCGCAKADKLCDSHCGCNPKICSRYSVPMDSSD